MALASYRASFVVNRLCYDRLESGDHRYFLQEMDLHQVTEQDTAQASTKLPNHEFISTCELRFHADAHEPQGMPVGPSSFHI